MVMARLQLCHSSNLFQCITSNIGPLPAMEMYKIREINLFTNQSDQMTQLLLDHIKQFISPNSSI